MKKEKAKSRKLYPVHQEINKNLRKLRADPDYKKGIKKLKRRRLHDEFENLKEEYANFISFYVYRRYLKAAKIRRGMLSQETELLAAKRAKEAVGAYRNMVSRLKTIDKLLTSSGVSKAVDRHAPAVLKNLRHNPKTPFIVEEFRQMGVPEHSISWLFDQMEDSNFDVLRMNGMNGKFNGLVKRATLLAPVLEKDVRVMKKHGIPVLEGSGSDAGKYAAAGTVIAIAIIVGLLFGF